MYHIKEDKRSQNSAQIICDGLSEILRRKPYETVSISDVCSLCGVARSTFYRLFDTLDDVLLYQFDLLFQSSLEEFSHSGEPYAKIILRIAVSDRALVSALISSGRTDLFDFATRRKEDEILSRMQLNISRRERIYCTPMLNAMVCAVIRVWLAEGCKESVSELYEIIKKNLRNLIDYM